VSPLPFAVFLVRLTIGGLLVVAGFLKLRAPVAFATEIANYQLFPSVAPYVAATLPLVEILIGAGLILFPRPWRRAAEAVALGLTVVFASAVGSAYARRIDIDCGCFGTGGGAINGLTLLRNVALVAATVFLLRFDRGRATSRRPQ